MASLYYHSVQNSQGDLSSTAKPRHGMPEPMTGHSECITGQRSVGVHETTNKREFVFAAVVFFLGFFLDFFLDFFLPSFLPFFLSFFLFFLSFFLSFFYSYFPPHLLLEYTLRLLCI